MRNDEYWANRALIRLTDAERTSIAYEKRIRKYYQKAEKDIEAMIENIYDNYAKDVGLDKQKLKMLLNAKETSDIWKKMKAKGYGKYVKENYKARISRLEAIKAQLYEKSKDLAIQEQKSLKSAIKKVTKDTYYRTTYDTSKATDIDSFTTLDDGTIDTVINTKWYGGNYSTRIWKNTDVLAAKLQDVMTRSVMTGASMAKACREIRDTFNTADYYAERLIRTETNHVHNESEALAYQAMGVEEYVFVATLDNRTSEVCQEHDQKRYKLSERKVGENYPPLHPNCRSTVRAFIDEETERNMQRRARNPITGKTEVVGSMNYQQWMEKHKQKGTWKEPERKQYIHKQETEQLTRYKTVLKDMMPEINIEEFKKFKIEQPDKWKELQKQYRVVNQYHPETDSEMSSQMIYNLHTEAYNTKRQYFPSESKKKGNMAIMDIDGERYYAHSKVKTAEDKSYINFKGDKNKLVLLPEKQHYKTLVLGSETGSSTPPWDRKVDSEAKLLEKAHSLIESGRAIKEINLLSELPCCESCMGVVDQFKKEHPDVIINVVSTKKERIADAAAAPKDKKGFMLEWKK